MEIFVKFLKGTDDEDEIEIEIKPDDMVADVKEKSIETHMEFTFQVADVKKSIETAQGADVYPAARQMLIHQGKVLKDGTTLEENKVVENSFVVIMLTKGIAEENGVLPNKLPEAPIVVDTADAIPKVAEPAISISNQTTTLSSAKPKYRHEYYQKPDQVVVTIFAKGIPAKTVSVDFDVPGEDAYSFQPRLFGKIIPVNCRYEVLSTKIEIRLAKAEAVHWASLEYSRDNVALQGINVPSGGQRPTYPSSKATKDWDKLEALVKKEEKDEKLDGDAALNKFFRDIYKDADEDTRRAMMKSFVESNGTVLSTNWKEVGAKKVEGSPPDGMEMKKWEI